MFKLIHISDVHYAANPKSANVLDYVKAKCTLRNPELLSGWHRAQGLGPKSHCPDIALGLAQFLSANLLDHHVIFVGGDVATTGLENDQRAAYNFLKGQPVPFIPHRTISGAPTLASRSKISVMPGNHDRFQDSWCRSNGVIFDQYFVKEWGGIGSRVRAIILRDNANTKQLCLIAGDFCLRDDGESFPPGWPACCGQGTVNSETLKLMCEKTHDIRRRYPEAGIIWLSHFPPASDVIGYIPNSQLNGFPDLIDAAVAHQIDIILSGHIHRNKTFIEKGVTIHTVGSACSYLEDAGNWIRSIFIEVVSSRAVIRKIQNYRWDSASKIFA